MDNQAYAWSTLTDHYKSLGLDFNIIINPEEENRMEITVFYKEDGEDMVMAYYISQDFLTSEHLNAVLESRMTEDRHVFGEA